MAMQTGYDRSRTYHGSSERRCHGRHSRRHRGRLDWSRIPEIEAKRYEKKLEAGNYLIAGHFPNGDQEKRVKEIFKGAGAEDITSPAISSTPEEK